MIKHGKFTPTEQPYFYWTFSAEESSSTMDDLLKWNQLRYGSELLLKKETHKESINPGSLKDCIQLRFAKGFVKCSFVYAFSAASSMFCNLLAKAVPWALLNILE